MALKSILLLLEFLKSNFLSFWSSAQSSFESPYIMNVAERPYYPLESSVVVRAFRTPLTLVVAFALFFPSSVTRRESGMNESQKLVPFLR